MAAAATLPNVIFSEEIYGTALVAARRLEGRNTEEVLSQFMPLEYPGDYVQESLREGKLNHATATFHLLAQQGVRRRAEVMAWSLADKEAAARKDDLPAVWESDDSANQVKKSFWRKPFPIMNFGSKKVCLL